MDVEKRYNIFKRWLKENNVYWNFMKNYESYRKTRGNIGSLIAYMAATPTKSLIKGAFIWATTAEGLDFWILLNAKWEKIYNEWMEKMFD